MNDHILIATAYNSLVRIYVAKTNNLVETARNIHETWPTATAALGRLLTAGAMMSYMYDGDNDLSIKVEGDGPIGQMIVESNNVGELRAIIKNPAVYLKYNDSNKLAVGNAVGHGLLTVRRNPHLKNSFSSSVNLINGEIAEDLTYYFYLSEQTNSSVGLGVLVNEDQSVKQAGGFILQLLPGATEQVIIQIEKALEGITSVTDLFESGLNTKGILNKLASGTEKILDEKPVRYFCGCSKDYYFEALKKLDNAVLDEMIDEDGGAEIICQYCKNKYHFSVDELHKIKSSR
ncbi:MAG: Hsp33 family molecular chaperone HslO [Acholeplasmataceae bacterium]|nr:Hsp33 family molecular chaperone HslO [Acholeplasmataceae bacterium]